MITFRILHSRLTASTFLATALAATSFVPGATAEDAKGDVTLLETLIVTARKREEDLRKVPMSVHVETAQDLEQSRAIDGQAVMKNVAGASLGTFGDRSNGFVVLRGVAPILSPLSADDSSVLTFIDGAPLPLGASFSSSYIDVERVEIIKGPQNTLFGRNTSGGAVNLIPVEPSHEFEGSAGGEVGTDGLYRAETMLNGSIIPGVLAGRIALRRSAANGYIGNVAGKALGAEGSWVGRASLNFTPSPATRWLVTLQGEDTDITPTTYIAIRPGQPKLAAQNHTVDDTQTALISSRFEHDFETVTFTSQTSFSTLNGRNTYNYPDAFIASQFSGLPPADFLNPATNFIDWKKRESRFTQEFRLSSAADAPFAWVTGVALYQDKAHRDRTSEMWYFGPSATGLMTYNQRTSGQAAFGEVTYPVLERLKLSVGARATREAKTFSSDFSSNGQNGAVPAFSERDKRSYGFVTGRAALSYEWSDDLMTYASIARGYKSGGYGFTNSLMWAGVPRNPYGSSSVLSYEIGGRGTFFGNRLQINTAAFLNDMKKEQVTLWDYTNFTGDNYNLDARSAGFELDGQFKVSGNWAFAGGLAYTFSELVNVPATAAQLQQGLASGNWLPTVPRWTARAAVNYNAAMSDFGLGDWLGESRFKAQLAYNYIGTRYTDASNFGKLDPVHLLSARLGVDWGNGEAYLFGENLLDKEYMTVKDRFGTDPASGSPVFGVSYARGATLGAGVKLRF